MTEPQSIREEVKYEDPPIPCSQKDDSNEKNKDVYFVIIRPSEEKIDFTGLYYETENKIEPIIVFNKTIDKEEKTYVEEIVFKFKKKKNQKKQKKIKTKRNQLNRLNIQLNL